ncbi:hypothetical protein FEM48_Zijuj12G0020300 [Ziziphus jujuba var. spinosa]|uniref:Uncharacterized protein n=1 Tax=Ziziphus jujuba var. spinosa TaxID=714518 RepID=A0A978UAK0_ZIZJJ|nr:hypothetical protein FEM48_Zijuj12G0020300 [Ziziphus jujuba var. spinosa]
MAKEMSVGINSFVLLLLLISENQLLQATITEAPTPQPQQSSNHSMSVLRNAPQDVQRRSTGSHVCSSAKSVVQNVCVCLRGLMGTNNSALAITTGRPKGEAPSVPKSLVCPNHFICTRHVVLHFMYL